MAWEEGGVDFCLSQITHAWKFRKWPEPGRENDMPCENKNWKLAFWGTHLERQTRPDGKRTNAKQIRYSQRWGLEDSLASWFCSRSSNSK